MVDRSHSPIVLPARQRLWVVDPNRWELRSEPDTHSIFFYLMDPLGQFVDAFGKNTTSTEVANKVKKAMVAWEEAGGNIGAGVPQ